MRSLRRLQRELGRFEAEVNEHYPNVWAMAGWSAPMIETVRNAATARAEIEGWISYRQQHRRDPEHIK